MSGLHRSRDGPVNMGGVVESRSGEVCEAAVPGDTGRVSQKLALMSNFFPGEMNGDAMNPFWSPTPKNTLISICQF